MICNFINTLALKNFYNATKYEVFTSLNDF